MVWDSVWEQVFTRQPWGKYSGEDLIRFVARHYYREPQRHAVRFLEVGCGAGANLWYLAREGFAAFGVDGAASAVEMARRRLSLECPGPDAPPRYGRIDVGDLVELGAEDCSFDALVDSEAVYANSLEDSRRIYAEMHLVSKPGGRLFVRTFATGTCGEGPPPGAGCLRTR